MSLYAIDGTTNKSYLGEERLKHTNVLRFCEASSDIGQFYERGVGTRKGDIGKVLGAAFGMGGRTRINSLYKNVCKTYVAGDKHIDVIGFSRGALLALGLVNKLAEKGIRDDKGKVVQKAPAIRFLGLWDAVGSFGLPFGPFQQVNIGHPENVPIVVEHCFHAMSLDERRDTFTPTRLKAHGAYEVWFRGVHSDVGGGNTNTALGNISLRWMLRKAKLVGVPIDENKVPTDADIDAAAAITEPFDILAHPLRQLAPGDRVHYTVSRRLDGRCNNPRDTCVVESEADELTCVRP